MSKDGGKDREKVKCREGDRKGGTQVHPLPIDISALP